jgi:DnaJ-class molecular chaperone
MSAFDNFDLYEELEISKESTTEEIKRAYKKLAMRWHPDKNQHDPSATEKFQRISHAYSTLSDPKKKSYYDKYGKLDEDNFNFEEFMKNFNFASFTDIFDEKMFGAPKGFFDGGVESRHSLKLMYIRKKAFNKPYRTESVHEEHKNENGENDVKYFLCFSIICILF